LRRYRRPHEFSQAPHFPITPKQIAEACIEARAAGVAVTHIHARDPETGDRSADPAHFRRIAELIKDAGVKPELEVFDAGHIGLANEFIEQGLIESPPLFQLCLGISYGAPATPKMVQALHDMLPRQQ